MRVEKTYYLDGVKLRSLEDFIRIVKCDKNLPFSEIKKGFEKEKTKEYATLVEDVEKMYKALPEMTVVEALKMPNEEQKMVALKWVGANKFVTELNAKIIDKQTITKTQKRWKLKSGVIKRDGEKPLMDGLFDDMFGQEIITFNDTYTLYQIEGKHLSLDEDVYIVHCVCPSTGRNYYLFSLPNTDSISAIARINGMSKEEYLEMETES